MLDIYTDEDVASKNIDSGLLFSVSFKLSNNNVDE